MKKSLSLNFVLLTLTGLVACSYVLLLLLSSLWTPAHTPADSSKKTIRITSPDEKFDAVYEVEFNGYTSHDKLYCEFHQKDGVAISPERSFSVDAADLKGVEIIWAGTNLVELYYDSGRIFSLKNPWVPSDRSAPTGDTSAVEVELRPSYPITIPGWLKVKQ